MYPDAPELAQFAAPSTEYAGFTAPLELTAGSKRRTQEIGQVSEILLKGECQTCLGTAG